MVARLQRSIDAMKTDYPGFNLVHEAGAFGDVAVWRGLVRPVRQLTSISALLADIEAERPVRVVEGEIVHHPNCEVTHAAHQLSKRLIYWRTPFELLVKYDGGVADPRCWVVTPPIPFDKRKHVWPDGSICAFLSSEGWDPDHDDVVDFMGHAAIWVFKWNIYNQTDVWLGREHQGTPDYHLRTLAADDSCWCRSGRRYAYCHRALDQHATRNSRGIQPTKPDVFVSPLVSLPTSASELGSSSHSMVIRNTTSPS
jgi:hypothetical protein